MPEHNLVWRTAAIVLALLLPPGPAGATDVLTANYGNERTNANLNETQLTPLSVNPVTFGKLYAYPVDGSVYAQPLYAHVTIAGARRAVLYVATMHNSVYAFDADEPPPAPPLWHVTLGSSVSNDYYGFNDIYPEVGILSTPVIDLAANRIYVVANTLENNVCRYRLHALDLATGAETAGGPVDIQAAVPGSASDARDGSVNFQPEQHLQRPGLLLLNNTVYVAFGSHGDMPPYHGWLIGYDAGNLQKQLAVFNTTPNGQAGAIWQGGRGLAADKDGNIYPAVANGDYDGTWNWGESILRLSTAGGLSVMDSFTTSRWDELNGVDMEVGISGTMLVPGTNLLVGASKLGYLYLLDRTGLGGMKPQDGQVLQTFQAVNFGLFGMALWNKPSGPLLYVSGWEDVLKAYQLKDGQFDTRPVAMTRASYANPYVGMTVSANGSNEGTGILWATTAEGRDFTDLGTLRAFDANDISRQLWSSETNPGRDRLGNFSKFAAPTVADGRVFVATFSNQVVVYGVLLPKAPRVRPPATRPLSPL